MDSAYDHIQEESYPQDQSSQQGSGDSTHQETANNFNAEIQDAYKAISSSPWAARLGGFFGTVKKQVRNYREPTQAQYLTATRASNTMTPPASSTPRQARQPQPVFPL